jgi:hypothetical protein
MPPSILREVGRLKSRKVVRSKVVKSKTFTVEVLDFTTFDLTTLRLKETDFIHLLVAHIPPPRRAVFGGRRWVVRSTELRPVTTAIKAWREINEPEA